MSEKCAQEETFKMENNPLNNIKKVIGVMSGKGGVGKSTILDRCIMGRT